MSRSALVIPLILPGRQAESPRHRRLPAASVEGEDDMQAARAELADYLVRLDTNLDTATLEATLALMLEECRGEIRRLRGLIALGKLAAADGRDRENSLDLKLAVEADLMAALDRVRDRGDLLGADDEAPAVGATIVSLRDAR